MKQLLNPVGYRTIIMAAFMILYNIADALGYKVCSIEEYQAAVNIVINLILGLLTILFRVKAQPKGGTNAK